MEESLYGWSVVLLDCSKQDNMLLFVYSNATEYKTRQTGDQP